MDTSSALNCFLSSSDVNEFVFLYTILTCFKVVTVRSMCFAWCFRSAPRHYITVGCRQGKIRHNRNAQSRDYWMMYCRKSNLHIHELPILTWPTMRIRVTRQTRRTIHSPVLSMMQQMLHRWCWKRTRRQGRKVIKNHRRPHHHQWYCSAVKKRRRHENSWYSNQLR